MCFIRKKVIVIARLIFVQSLQIVVAGSLHGMDAPDSYSLREIASCKLRKNAKRRPLYSLDKYTANLVFVG